MSNDRFVFKKTWAGTCILSVAKHSTCGSKRLLSHLNEAFAECEYPSSCGP